MKTFFHKILLTSTLLLLAMMPLAIHAQSFLEDSFNDAEDVALNSGFTATSDNAQGDIIDTAINILNILFAFLGTLLFAIFIYAGFRYLTAGGNDGQIKESLSWMKNALIGLALILTASGVTTFILRTFVEEIL